MGDRFDLEALALPGAVGRSTPRVPRHQRGERFLKGPIPWAWIARAAPLPGRALAVGLIVWMRAGMIRTGVVTVTGAHLAELGIQRTTAYRALRSLEEAGLVAVQRHRGRAPVVTLLDAGLRPSPEATA